MRTTVCFLIVALGAGCRSGKLISIDTASSSVSGSGSDEEGQTTTDDTGASPSDDTSSTGTDDTGTSGTIDSGTPSADDTGADFTEEICDGIDNDGDGEIDEGFEADADGDGVLDCVDVEDCDGADNDGDGLVDEDFTDTDRDGTADCLDIEECDGLDNDGDGLVDEGFDSDEDGLPDCFDSEICDGIDNDGDGEIDEAGAYGEYTWYRDADGDGVGVEEDSIDACDAPDGMTADRGDCDDSDASVYPGATEICDGVDNDCDGSADEEGAVGSSTFYRDADGDGYGTAATTTTSCDAPDGYVSNSDDCNDSDSAISPAAIDVCDGLDNDCDGGVDEDTPDTDADGTVDCLDFEECDGLDNDGDGTIDEGFDFTGDGSPDCTDDDGDGLSEADGDCDDSLDTVYPGAPEVDDGIDNDCDGEDLITVLFELSHGEGTWSDPEAYDTYTGWGYAADIIEDMGAEWGRLDDGPVT
ncbi:MAG: putative metal-binding motif-containing protein, partial [Myxococcota bacterium]